MTTDTAPDPRRYLPTGETCFVCGEKNPRGLHLRFFTLGDGQARAEWTPDASLTGYEGVVHGGVIGTVLDEVLGWSVSLACDRFTVTGELTVRYLKPVPPERPYTFTARPVEDRKRYWTAEGDLRDAAGTVHARAQGKFFVLSPEETRAVALRLTYQPGDLPIFLEKAP